MGARMYDPELGRFISPDTIIPDPGNPQDLNRYAYVRNNPLAYVDPSGHEPSGWLDQLIGFVSGAGYQYVTDMQAPVMALSGANDSMVYQLLTAVSDAAMSDEAAQSGRKVGRALSQIHAGAMILSGAAKMIVGGATMLGTGIGGGACTGVTGGVCAIPTVGALTAEAALVGEGAAEAGYGVGVIAFAKRGSGSSWAAKNSQTRTIKGYMSCSRHRLQAKCSSRTLTI